MNKDISNPKSEPKAVSERRLELKSFTEKIEVSEQVDVNQIPLELRPLAILVPGIRTNAEWIDEAARDAETFGIPVEIVKATEGRISALHLLTRIGLGSIRRGIKEQILSSLYKHKGRPISLICHSMGTDVVCDILQELPPFEDFRFERIIFLGSICHHKRAKDIIPRTKRFINHRGTFDQWPIIAYIVRGDRYCHTGTFGFNKGEWVKDITFNNDHFTCTGRDHVINYVLPQISNTDIQVCPRVNHPFNYNVVWLLRQAFVFSFPVAALGYFYPLLFCTPLVIAVVSLIYCLWPRKIPR
jgi:hypothetical protein